jgi:hypothetical protein
MGPDKKRCAQRRLQLGNLAAQGGLGDRQRLRRLAKMQRPRDFAEIHEVAEFEVKLILARHH